jgi:hypothetical protein
VRAAVGKTGVEPRGSSVIHDITPRKPGRAPAAQQPSWWLVRNREFGNHVVHRPVEPDYYCATTAFWHRRCRGGAAAHLRFNAVHPRREKFDQACHELQSPTNAFDCE